MAGLLTFTQLRSEVLDNASKASIAKTRSTVTLDDMAGRYVNRAARTIARREDLLFCIATASTTADQKDYAMPSNIKSLFSLRLEDGLNSVKLRPSMPWEFDKIVPKPDEASTGTPDWYVPFKASNTFELFKIPDAVYTMRMRYSYWPTRLSADADLSEYTHMDDVLIYYATAYLYFWLQEYEDAAQWKALADDEFSGAINAERQAFPDWAPKSRGFTTQPPSSVGEYYNDPFVNSDGAIRSTI